MMMNSGEISCVSCLRLRLISVSPMGERQSVGGAMILTFLNALCRARNCSRVMVFGVLFLSSCAFSQTALVVRSPMLLNSVLRKDESFLLLVCFAILMSVPSSMP